MLHIQQQISHRVLFINFYSICDFATQFCFITHPPTSKITIFYKIKISDKINRKNLSGSSYFLLSLFFSPILVIFLHPLNQFLAPSLHFPNLRLSNLCLIAFVDVIIPLILHNFFSKNPRTI